MNRDVTREEIISTVKKLRSKVPSVAIRTSVMVGFPGETAAEFNDLKALVEELEFEHLGCFTYSQEEGTVAGRMPDQIDDTIKERRQDEIMSLQKQISRRKLQRFVGQRIPVLVSGPSEESELVWQGRMSVQAPEVDGLVYLNDGPVRAGQIQEVEITDSYDYDLVGRVIH
jgi:ribosomal protein S12 methylthiotransferase